MITKPKDSGSLRVIRLETQNEALLLKYLHKFFNNHDLPWVDFLVIEELALFCGKVY
jgi:hypothetical protein